MGRFWQIVRIGCRIYMLTIFIIPNITFVCPLHRGVTLKELKRLLKINCQQINSDTYVGCISGRIRNELWKRINKEPMIREANMLYAMQNHVIVKNKGSDFNKIKELDLIDLIRS